LSESPLSVMHQTGVASYMNQC